jgi:hypothetical protein
VIPARRRTQRVRLLTKGDSMSEMPSSRSLFAVDVEKYTHRQDRWLPKVREVILRTVPTAFAKVGVDWEEDLVHLDDTGDGLIATMADVGPHRLVDAAYWLDRQLRLHNRDAAGLRLRMRVAVHVGPIHVADGSGAAKNELCRLLDDDDLRAAMKATRGNVALIVSDVVYRTAVAGGYTEEVEPDWFRRVESQVKDTLQVAWVTAPANDLPQHPIGTPAREPGRSRPSPDRAPAAPAAPAEAGAKRPAVPAGGVRIGGSVHGNSVIGGTNHGDMRYGATDRGRAGYRDPDDEPYFGRSGDGA